MIVRMSGRRLFLWGDDCLRMYPRIVRRVSRDVLADQAMTNARERFIIGLLDLLLIPQDPID